MNEVTVVLSEEQAHLFKLFLEHNAAIVFMAHEGCFGMRSGSFTVNVDRHGALTSIEKREFSYPQTPTRQ